MNPKTSVHTKKTNNEFMRNQIQKVTTPTKKCKNKSCKKIVHIGISPIEFHLHELGYCSYNCMVQDKEAKKVH